ncbi:MAG: FG-GAP-like repeat-containing protein [Saprospiraceae bacterium]
MKHFWIFLLLAPVTLACQPTFTKVTDPANPAVTFINNTAPYKGTSWIDLNDDNLPDLFVCPKSLFRNDGNGQFTQLPDLNGATAGQGAAGASWGDVDNDGYPDCITASLVSGYHRNNGDQTFALESSNLPGMENYPAWDCALADVDNNGRLDLLFVHANGFHNPGPFSCRMYRQQHDGSFNLVSGYEFTNQLAPYTIPTWADYDLDGDMDLFIGAGPAGTPGPDFCYKNLLKENGTFSLQRLTATPFNVFQDGQTYNFIDFDNDGDLDICLTNYNGASNRFWRNNNGSYTAMNTPFTTQSGHLANVWGDLDNDGDLDVLITSDAAPTVRLFRNNGNGTFNSGTTAGSSTGNICGVALADYDNDGDLDFYTNGGGGGRALFRNDSPPPNGNWAAFKLYGVQSNRSAIGAVLRLKAVLNGQPTWQIRHVQAHNSFQSQNELRQHFGLADATAIDSLEVRWPSGLVEVFAGLAGNSFYKIVEGQGISVLTGVQSPENSPLVSVYPNPVSDQGCRVKTEDGNASIAAIQLFDASGRLVPLRTNRVDNASWHLLFDNTLAPGSYFVRVVFEDYSTRTSVIYKH